MFDKEGTCQINGRKTVFHTPEQPLHAPPTTLGGSSRTIHWSTAAVVFVGRTWRTTTRVTSSTGLIVFDDVLFEGALLA